MTDTEKAALERRIDELCVEVEYNRQTSRSRLERIDQLKDENAKLRDEIERLHAEQAHWELGNCPSCQNVADLQEALEHNAKLREYAAKAWSLFIRHGAVHTCDLSEVDAVRDELRSLGIEVSS